MPVSLEHEEYRWGYMYDPNNKSKMITRLRRITVKEKLHYFMVLARRYGDMELLEMARQKREELYPSVPNEVFESVDIFSKYQFEL